jgi:hypothetical protein
VPASERGVAGLVLKCLDPLGPAMLAIANEGMHSSASSAKVRALRVGASEVLGVDPSGGLRDGF